MNAIQALVDALALELERPVEVDDQRFRAIAYSAHADRDIDHVRLQSILQREAPKEATAWLKSLEIQDAERYVRIPRNARLGMEPRVCLPIRCNDVLLGYLWLLDAPSPLAEAELEASARYANELGIELFRLRRLEGVGRYQEAEVVRELLVGTGDVSAAVGRWRQAALANSSFYTCIMAVIRGENEADDAVGIAASLDATRRSVAPHHFAATVEVDEGIAVLAHDDPDEPLRRARHLYDQLTIQLRDRVGTCAAVGCSAPRTELSGLRSAWTEARAAVAVASSVEGRAPVLTWDDLGSYRAIATIVEGGVGARAGWADVLGGLAAASDGAALIRTLEAYLDNAGDARRTAQELSLHRSSLYNRVHRIESLTGRDLRSGDARLELHLAVRLWRLAGAPTIERLSDDRPRSGAAR